LLDGLGDGLVGKEGETLLDEVVLVDMLVEDVLGDSEELMLALLVVVEYEDILIEGEMVGLV
jgi:hypothetical protein